LKKQSQLTRSECCVLRIARTKLKKQTQFEGRQIGVNSYMKGAYGEIPPCGAQKNKANLIVQHSACCVLRHAFVIPVKTGIQSLGSYGFRINRLCHNQDFANFIVDYKRITKVIWPIFELRHSPQVRNDRSTSKFERPS
jgi:hypothetical protein